MKNSEIKDLTIEECHKVNQDFADKFNLEYVKGGTVSPLSNGKNIGFTHQNFYVDFNPIEYVDYEHIEEFYSEEFYEITPEGVYSKTNCLCITSNDEKAIKDLANWVKDLEDRNVSVKEYDSKNRVQRRFRMAVKIES